MSEWLETLQAYRGISLMYDSQLLIVHPLSSDAYLTQSHKLSSFQLTTELTAIFQAIIDNLAEI